MSLKTWVVPLVGQSISRRDHSVDFASPIVCSERAGPEAAARRNVAENGKGGSPAVTTLIERRWPPDSFFFRRASRSASGCPDRDSEKERCDIGRR